MDRNSENPIYIVLQHGSSDNIQFETPNKNAAVSCADTLSDNECGEAWDVWTGLDLIAAYYPIDYFDYLKTPKPSDS